MLLQQLLSTLPSQDYNNRLRTIEQFLGDQANRTDLTGEAIEQIIDATVDASRQNRQEEETEPLLRQFLGYPESSKLLIHTVSGLHLKRLICMDLREAYQICLTEHSHDVLFDLDSTEKKLYSNEEVETLFIQSQAEKEELFNDPTFSFYFQYTPVIAKNIYDQVSVESKIAILLSPIMSQSFSSQDYCDCLSKLPSSYIIDLICNESIRSQLTPLHIELLILKLSEEDFLYGVAHSTDFLALIPEFNFADSGVMKKISSFSVNGKNVLLSRTDFMLKLTLDCQIAFIDSYSTVEEKIRVLRSPNLITLLQSVREQGKSSDALILHLLFNKHITKALSVDEIILLLDHLDHNYLQIMSYLANGMFLDKIEGSEELSIKVAALICRKFSYPYIYSFITRDFELLFRGLFKFNVLKVFFIEFPLLAISLLTIPDYIETYLELGRYRETVLELGRQFDTEQFLRLAVSSKNYRRVINDDPESPQQLSLQNFILNSDLNEESFLAIFKTDPAFIKKCSLDQWFFYLQGFYKEQANKERLALYLLGEIIQASQSNVHLQNPVLLLSGLQELSLELLAKLLLSERDEIPTLLIRERDRIENFTAGLISQIIKEAQPSQKKEAQGLIERLLRLDTFVNDFKIDFQRALLYIKSVSVDKSISLLREFNVTHPLEPLQWKLLISKLKKEERKDVLEELFFNADLVKAMGSDPLIYAMNIGAMTLDHLASIENDTRMQLTLIHDSFTEPLKSHENESARKMALKIPELQKKLYREKIFDEHWDDKAVKGPFAGLCFNELVPTHVKQMRDALRRKEDFSSIKAIAKNAASNQRFWLWNTRRTEVQKFYEEVANLQEPLSDEDITNAKEMIHGYET